MIGHNKVSQLDSVTCITAIQGNASYKSLVVRKQVFRVSDQVWHIPGCAVTEDG